MPSNPPSTPPPSKRIDALLGRLFIAAISVLIALGIVEFVSRWFISSRPPIERQFPVQIYRRPQPYTMFGGKPGAGELNRLGYRGEAPDSPKPEGEFRAFMLGGSTVVVGEPPIAAILEGVFAENGYSGVRVYNFGVVSSVSSQELARVLVEIADLEPDLVIFYNGGNDIFHPVAWDPRPGYPFNFVVVENNPILESEVGDYPVLPLLAYGSNVARFLFPSYFLNRFAPLDGIRGEAGWNTEAWRQEIADTYVRNLVKAGRVSEAFGAEFIAFFQPVVYFKENRTPGEEEHMRKAQGDLNDRLTVLFDISEFAADMRRRTVDGMEKAVKESSAHLVDLSGIYEDVTDEVFTDMIHTRQEMKPTVAEAIFRNIVDRGLVPNASGTPGDVSGPAP